MAQANGQQATDQSLGRIKCLRHLMSKEGLPGVLLLKVVHGLEFVDDNAQVSEMVSRYEQQHS